MPLPLVAAAVLTGGAVSIGIEVALNRMTGKKTTERDVVEAGLIGALPGVGLAKGFGQVGYRLYKGRKVLKGYKGIGTAMYGYGRFGKLTGIGGSTIPHITYEQARKNMYVYAAIGGIPAARGMAGAYGVSKALDMIYSESTRPSSETQREISSRNVGVRSGPSRGSVNTNRKRSKSSRSRLSRRDSASRGKTYCKKHKKYDFCQRYKLN